MGQLLPFRPPRPGESREDYEEEAVEFYKRRIDQLHGRLIVICVAGLVVLASALIMLTGVLLCQP